MANEKTMSAEARGGDHEDEPGGRGARPAIPSIRDPPSVRPRAARHVAHVLHDRTRYIRRYMIVSVPQATATTLWAITTIERTMKAVRNARIRRLRGT